MSFIICWKEGSLDQFGSDIKPIYVKSTSLISTLKSLSVLIIILLLAIYFKQIDRHSTFLLFCQYWIMQEGSLDRFESDRTTCVKSNSLISTLKSHSVLIVILLLAIYFKQIDRHSTFFLICQYWIMQEGSLDRLRSDRPTCVKSTSLISTLNLFLF